MKSATGINWLSASARSSFNPRAREERDGVRKSRRGNANRFNPRAREERDIMQLLVCGIIACFNPRAREERDKTIKSQRMIIEVSIHALVKSATAGSSFRTVRTNGFNPRAREERDAYRIRKAIDFRVSIHALVKSATRQFFYLLHRH